MKEELTLNWKEQKRLIVLNQVETDKLMAGEAAVLLELSERQVWRLLSFYRKEGARALAHGNRGRKPANAIEEQIRRKVLELATTKYEGFNHLHFTEKLAERESIFLSLSSVRNILLESGLRSPRKRRSPKHRSRRERYPQEGMLLQIDGSPHDWLEGRGPELCLVGAIDDATNKVPYALFQKSETTEGYMRMLQEIVLNQGIPLALYHDRHSIFEVTEEQAPSIEEQLEGKEPKTQFGRLLAELGIDSIPANSPQAKGRIERLWGTFQDRLTSELRLAGARTIEEANQVLAQFLPEYNRRFSVPAKDTEVTYRKVEKGFKAEEFFCFKYQRTVGADNVVRFNHRRLQILPSENRLSYAKCKVEVQVRLDGSLAIYYQRERLNIQTAPWEATALRRKVLVPATAGTNSATKTTPPKPSPDHPWRLWVYRANKE